jgi:hypothetical protein
MRILLAIDGSEQSEAARFFASAMGVWEIGSVLKNCRGWRRRRALKLRLVTGAANSDVELKIARRV